MMVTLYDAMTSVISLFKVKGQLLFFYSYFFKTSYFDYWALAP